MARGPVHEIHPAERLAALVNYGLLIVAPFTLNSLGLLAMLIAYSRRGSADPVAKSHFDFQIRRYWMDLTMVALGFICASGALAAGFGAAIEGAMAAFGVQLPVHYDVVHIGLGAIVLLVLWIVLWLMGLLGLLLGSLFGALRLATGMPMGKTRAR
jgi:uncharacterized membrane protein